MNPIKHKDAIINKKNPTIVFLVFNERNTLIKDTMKKLKLNPENKQNKLMVSAI